MLRVIEELEYDKLLFGRDRSPDITVWLLVEATASKVVGDNHICHSVKDKLDVGGVGGAGHMTVYFLVGTLVLRFKLCLNVRGCFAILLGSYKPMK